MKYSKADVLKIIYECILKLQSLGPEFEITKQDLSIDCDFFDATGTWGMCAFGIVKGEQRVGQQISFNANLMHDGLKDAIISTVYHEFCHYFQNKEAVKAGFYYFDDNGDFKESQDEAKRKYFIGDGDGHSECWLKYVKVVNEKLKPVIPVASRPQEIPYKAYLDFNKDKTLFTIYCTKCDATQTYISLSEMDLRVLPPGFLATVILMQQQNRENNFCKCGGCLKIRANSEETLYNILKKDRDRYLDLRLKGEI